MTYFWFITIFIIFNLIIYLSFENISKKINLFDLPNDRKIHKKKISCIGGFFIITSLIFLVSFFQNRYFNAQNLFLNNSNFLSFYLVSIFIFFVGILDDKVNLSPFRKIVLLIFFLTAAVTSDTTLIINNLKISFLNLEILFPENFAVFFTILCIFVFLNAFNMFDGMDMQSGIYSLAIFFAIMLKSGYFQIFLPIIISLIFFLFLNYRKVLFLGNNGSYLVAYIISWFCIKLYNFQIIKHADYISLLLIIPILDLLRLTIERLLKNKNPMSPDNNHIHHLLLRKYKYTKTLFIISSLFLLPIILEIYFPILPVLILTIISYFYIIYFLVKKIKR
tara:strand:- start:202 stop:1206 length:1005 start_codon:yes stop_codon:yes gene_type:complete